MFRYVAALAIVVLIALASGCKEKQTLQGEWIFYYSHGDSMVYQFDTAQMIIRKFSLSEVMDSPGEDTIVTFERVFFYQRSKDTLFLDWAVPTDTGVALVPSSYHLITGLSADSLMLTPEMGEPIPFKRLSYKVPEQTKAEMIERYRNWLQRKIDGEI